MPINRPKFKIKLDLSSLNDDKSQIPSTNEHLENNFNSLLSQMREMPIPHFRKVRDTLDYSRMRQSGFFAMSQGFRMNNHSNDFFIHARRESPQSQGEFAGDKFHISVQRDMVQQAFQALSGFLFSEDSPVDTWKVTDMERVDQQARVSVGAQFTLYINPDQENSQYSALSLHKTRQFIKCLESTLSESGIIPGQRPESDVHPINWKYLSYRNELRSGRDGDEMQSQALRDEPFYRLMTE